MTPIDDQTAPENTQNPGSDVERGVYMYGIVQGDAGLDPQELSTRDDVYTVEAGGLRAYVRSVDVGDYSRESLQGGGADQEWLIREAQEHHAVVAEVHKSSAILPAKFGSVYESDEIVREALLEMADQVRARLELLADSDEWAIHVLCDSEGMTGEVLERDPELRELALKVDEASEGRSYMMRRQFQNRLQEAYDAYRDEVATSAIDELGQWTTAIQKEEPRESEGETGNEVTRASVLVRRESTESFLEHAEHIHSTREGLELQITGPWPPYTFATIAGEDDRDG